MSDPKHPMVGSDDSSETSHEEDWGAAMAEQNAESTEKPATAEQNAESTDETATADEADPWAEALAEQQSGEQQAEIQQAKAASEDVFKPLDEDSGGSAPRELSMVMGIPVKLNVELGRTSITIKQLLELSQGSVIELDGMAGDHMDIMINGHLIAQGEVVVVDDKYGIRVTEIITPAERAQQLN